MKSRIAIVALLVAACGIQNHKGPPAPAELPPVEEDLLSDEALAQLSPGEEAPLVSLRGTAWGENDNREGLGIVFSGDDRYVMLQVRREGKRELQVMATVGRYAFESGEPAFRALKTSCPRYAKRVASVNQLKILNGDTLSFATDNVTTRLKPVTKRVLGNEKVRWGCFRSSGKFEEASWADRL